MVAAVSLLYAASRAEATVIPVTTEDDIVADDGACSLREAVSAVNDAAPSGTLPGECPAGDGADTILLGSGTYTTSLGAAGDDANAGGDFDLARSVTIEGSGGATRIRNGLGSRSVVGDGDRLFHVDPAGAGDVDVVFRGLTLMEGEASCGTAGCTTGAAAIEASQARDLAVEDCTFTQNTTVCTGTNCGRGSDGAAAAIVHGAAGNLYIVRTTFTRNRAECSGSGCRTGHVAFVKTDPDGTMTATAELVDVDISKNTGFCSASGCIVRDVAELEAGQVALTSVEFRSNQTSCEGAACILGSILDIDASTMQLASTSLLANRRYGEGDASDLAASLTIDGGVLIGTELTLKSDRVVCRGDGCRVDEVMDADVDLAEIDGLTVASTRGQCLGVGCIVDERIYLANFDGVHAIRGATITKNYSLCREDGCRAQAILFLRGVELELSDAVISSNKVFCAGDACFMTPAVAFYSISDTVQSVVDSVDVIGNRCSCRADECTVLAPGCGIFVVAGGSAGLLVRNATIAKNRGDSVGAGIGSLATLVLEDSEITRNQSIRGGGGVYNGGLLTVDGVTIANNRTRADRASYRDFGTLSPVCGDGSGDCGGGILNQGTIASVTATIFSGNRPDDCIDDGGTGCP